MKVISVAKVDKEQQSKPIFTGSVTKQAIIDTSLSDRFEIIHVNFDKGARNKFHTHSAEQVLIVTEGKGIVATDNEEIIVVPGDIVFITANEKHWHGATKDSTFSHLYVMAPDSKTTLIEE